jgi:hypothetical protein
MKMNNNTNNPISFLRKIWLEGPDVEICDHDINEQLYLYKMLYNIRFIYPEDVPVSSGPKIYAHLVNIVSNEYYCDVYNHKPNEIPITTNINKVYTSGFPKGPPFMTATIGSWHNNVAGCYGFYMNIHNPNDGTYKKVPFVRPSLHINPLIIKTMMKYNKGFGVVKVENENE